MSRTCSGSSSSGARSPFRTVSWLASAVFVLTIAVLALVAVLKAPEAPSVTPSDEPRSPLAAPTGAAPCPHLNGGLLDTVEWAPTLNAWVPESPTLGPAVVDSDGFRRCFSRTAEGALLAAANYVLLGSVAPDLRERLASEATVPGPGRDAAKAAAGAAVSAPAPSIQIAGYRVVAMSDEAATVAIVVRTADNRLVQGEVPLAWHAGDWKLVVDPETGRYTTLFGVSNLGGVTPWSAAP